MATREEAQRFGRNKRWQFAGVERIGARTLSTAVTLTANDAEHLYLDASTAGFTVTLPAAPYEGQTYHFSENANSANAVLIDGNGKNVNGAASLTMNAAFRQRVLRYNGTQWIVVGGIG